MKLTPTNLQLRSSSALLEYQHGLLWADPGTGKTLTALLVAEELREAGDIAKILILAPKIALSMWAEVILTQWGEKAQVFRKTNGTTWNKLGKEAVGIIITTYDIAAREAPQAKLRKWVDGLTLVIMDESHLCKSESAKRAQAVLEPPAREVTLKAPNGDEISGKVGRNDRAPGFATQANYVLQLTGTPMTRYPDDLWMQLAYVRSGVLKTFGVETYNQFVRKFCTSKEVMRGNRKQWVVGGAKNTDELRKLLNACKIVRMSLEEAAAELPPVTYRTVTIDLPKKFEKIKVGDDELIREIQKPNSPYAKRWHEIGMEKVDQAADYILDTQVGKPALIGVWHKDVGKALLQRLKDHGAAIVDGNTSSAERDRIAADFNAGKLPFLIGQMKAMGVSWNLQEAASHVVVVEELPSPGDLEQFVARVYRKGQTKHVQVDLLASDDGLDEALTRIRAEKRAVSKKVLE